MKENEDGEIDRDFIAAELFEAISHPTRIQILKMLEKTPQGFSELKHGLGISSSGNLNHHLNKLSTLVGTDAHGKYVVTDQGREALYVVKASRAENEPRSYTTLTIIISALIFYSVYTTAAMVLGRFDYNTLMFGLLLIVLFPLVFRHVYPRVKKHASLGPLSSGDAEDV
jgi:DNA-binding transcriptional ArsR family regulator